MRARKYLAEAHPRILALLYSQRCKVARGRVLGLVQDGHSYGRTRTGFSVCPFFAQRYRATVRRIQLFACLVATNLAPF